MNFKRLYTLFCIPSLIHLRLDGWPFWSSAFCEDRAWAKLVCVGASNIEDLSLTSGDDAPGDDLREVLSWPRALKRFTFVPHYNSNYNDTGTIPSELQHILQHQRLTLEYLHAGVPNCNSGKERFGRLSFHWKLTANNRFGHVQIARAPGFSGSQALTHLCQFT